MKNFRFKLRTTGIALSGLAFLIAKNHVEGPAVPRIEAFVYSSTMFKEAYSISCFKTKEQDLLKNFRTTAIKEHHAMALAQNHNTQHRFIETNQLLQTYEKEFDLKPVQWVLFDINVELDNYHLVQTNLYSFKDFSAFNYLIRLVQFSDYKGNLIVSNSYKPNKKIGKIIELKDDLIASLFHQGITINKEEIENV